VHTHTHTRPRWRTWRVRACTGTSESLPTFTSNICCSYRCIGTFESPGINQGRYNSTQCTVQFENPDHFSINVNFSNVRSRLAQTANTEELWNLRYERQANCILFQCQNTAYYVLAVFMSQVEKLFITIFVIWPFVFRWSDGKHFVIVLAYKR
jgi:hypothetical protein